MLDQDEKKILSKVANTIRQLSMEAVQKANSGHPGLPMGCAEIGAYLYGKRLSYNPKKPLWINRDRLVLSAGHGSIWLYSLLHLSGYKVSIEDLKQFRQLHSITPGHPEYRETPGVEATTGPLGQGIGNAVGQALGLKILGKKFNSSSNPIFDSKVYCLAGDGCLMEGVSNEVSSFAGHLKLNNLVLIHDANKITLDGHLEQCCSEDVIKRYQAYGFDTYTMDGNDLDSIHATFTKIDQDKGDKPIFIDCKTIIGKGSPSKQGSHTAHGSPLGEEEVKKVIKLLDLPEEPFYVEQSVRKFFDAKEKELTNKFSQWEKVYFNWREKNSDFGDLLDQMYERVIDKAVEKEIFEKVVFDEPISGRKASQAVLQVLGKHLPFLYGGSADLSGSDCTMMKDFELITAGDFSGRNIKYGIREFGMATIASGLYQSHFFLPYIGTFLTFSDYMRNGIRLAALSHCHVIYQFTHDSIFLGEDGPTHQPVEHVAALRAMPNLQVIRPADGQEVKGAWLLALRYEGPSAIILSRQNLPLLEETKKSFEQGVSRGGYIARKEKSKPKFTLFSTGSEMCLAVEVANALEQQGHSCRVISMPCFEAFERQDKEYKQSVVGGDLGQRVCIEAGVRQGWDAYIGIEGISVTVDTFGLSAPASDLAEEFGFTVDAILNRLL
ncbi:transketolase [Candidatus Aerophobetes bacterium]|uniref:Transketolase n=1 Tax=Aerophobetes bacterium TaxID=2030807 RepID=A0A2A4X4M2_UNCAE|nr:MAG: transketolase [Candidatus Aerophobetes bacterium]